MKLNIQRFATKAVVPSDIEKVDRSQFVTFLNTTPAASSKTFVLLGVGITDYGISYNPQVDTEKWIVEDNARIDHTSNQKQGNVSQKIYKNEPCFEFVRGGLDKLNYKTEILDIDTYTGSEGNFPAKLSAGKIAITQYMNENAVIEYTLYYEGDPIEGTASFDENGVPTFTPTTSL